MTFNASITPIHILTRPRPHKTHSQKLPDNRQSVIEKLPEFSCCIIL